MDHRIELRHLRYFIAVAEELHFGRAAQRLHLAQPPLSQQIRQLEAIVGHPLFTRTSRAVKLTSSGEALLGRARRTLQSVEEGLEEARSIGRGEVGFLRVGLIGSCMLTMQAGVPALLREYRQRYPKVNLQLQESFMSGVIRGLTTGVLDAGFLRDGGPCDGLVVQKIFTEPFVAVLPSSHRLAKRKIISTRDLRDEPFVFFPREAGLRAYERSISVCEVNGFRPRVVQEASNWLTILRLVGTGLGVTVAPDCVRQIAARDVICRPLKENEVRSDIELAYRMNEDRAMVKAFAAAIRSH